MDNLDLQYAWLSGLYEAEGSISWGGSFHLCISMVDKWPLEISKLYYKKAYLRGPYRLDDIVRQPYFRWVVNKREDVINCISYIQPWLHSRRKVQIAKCINSHPEHEFSHVVYRKDVKTNPFYAMAPKDELHNYKLTRIGSYSTREEATFKVNEYIANNYPKPQLIDYNPILTSESLIAWSAGFFEGDGYVFVGKASIAAKKPSVKLGVRIIDKDIAIAFQDIFQCGTVTGPYYCENRKPVWHWNAGKKRNSFKVMQLIKPLLSPRRQKQIELAIQNSPICNFHYITKTKANTFAVKEPGTQKYIKTYKTYELAQKYLDQYFAETK